MQGLQFRAFPATWKRWRTLMPSHSIRRGPPVLARAAVRGGIGKGAEAGHDSLAIAQNVEGAGRTANQIPQAGIRSSTDAADDGLNAQESCGRCRPVHRDVSAAS
jgi:hypothetical protein